MTGKPTNSLHGVPDAAQWLHDAVEGAELDVLGYHVEKLVPEDEMDVLDLVRHRLQIGDDISDMTIASSLATIAGHSDHRGRWLAAFGSPIGRVLAVRGADLNNAINTLVALSLLRRV